MIRTYKSCIIKILLLFFINIIFINGALAAHIESADSAYKTGHYDQAVTLYNEILKNEGSSSELYYNLGNAYAKIGDYGNAVLCYLRSLRLDPSNKNAKENLNYIESKVIETNNSELKDKKLSLDAENPSFFYSVRMFISENHLSDTWAIWALVCFLVFIACLSCYLFCKNVIIRKIGFFGGIFFIFISILTLIFSFIASSYKSNQGVIISPKVKLLSEASSNSKENPVFLTRGTRMTILDIYPTDSNEPKWYKVRLNSDFVGWIEASDFIPVDK